MPITRRAFHRAAAALAAAAALRPAGATSEWTVLQPAPLSGVNGGVGWHLRLGALLAFQAANAAGGVHGRPLRLLTLDEEPGRVSAQVRDAARVTEAVALLGLNGRRAVAELAQSGLPSELGLPVVGVKCGSGSGAGFDAPWLFSARAGYADEISQVFRHAATTFARRVALVTTLDDDGNEISTLATAAAHAQGVDLMIAPPHAADTAEVAPAVAAVLGTPHDAVLLGTNTAAVSYFAKLYRAAGGHGRLVTLSAAEATQLALVVGPQAARGVVISQVVPHPRDPKVQLMREMMAAWQRFAPAEANPTLTMTEGFVAARVLIDALQRSGPAAGGATLMRTLTAARAPLDLDGLRVSLLRDGPHFHSLSVIDRDGQVLY